MKDTNSVNRDRERKYFSLFSGVGGFELAINKVYELQKLGTKSKNSTDSKSQSSQYGQYPLCVGFSEIDKYAISVYQYHYQEHKNYGDIKNIDWNTVPDFDLVVGGSPCQDLSVAGKQKGLSGARSGLFFEFIRCLKEKQPTNFIWENVKGALSSSNGWDFARVQIEFSEAGYDIEWQVLNAKDFGVPQNRERIFVVGHLRGTSQPKVFPITNSSKSHLKYSGGVISAREQWLKDGKTKSRNFSQGQRIYGTDGIAQSLAGNAGGQGGKTGLYETPKIRRLTPLECERLMSWPDGWTICGRVNNGKDLPYLTPISDTQRYKMCGNGVVSKVVEAIIERL